MGEKLKQRLKQTRFQSLHQEAMLNLLVAASFLEGTMDRLCAGFGITHQQYNILRILKGAGESGHPCGEIAERMIHPSPDVTRRLDALEREGFVERTRSTEDRRVVITRITDKGLQLLDSMNSALQEHANNFSNQVSEADCEELSRICEQIYGGAN